MGKRIILTSYGLTTKVGKELIGMEIMGDGLADKRIFLFHEPHYFIEDMLVNACTSLGFKKENVILSGQQKSNEEVEKCDYIYCTEGNTFEVMSILRERGLDSTFINAFNNGATYIGASAGAMIAGVSIEEAIDFDKNFVRMTDFTGLGLFDGIIIPHYTKDELERYIKNSPGIEEKYTSIRSVANDEILCIIPNDESSEWEVILGNTSIGKETIRKDVAEKIVEIDLSKDELFKYMIEPGGHVGDRR